ncbi:hypothetical protein [Francisella sp. TX07-6608]|uniref:hypothetical protein n=1 Tax=Francisella sp. TX07-6608 TaxID=573568 RepID=UPI0008F98AF6|nr:hypothetical protein [Francisella sp. TX07-6608]OIN82913.1 hypothetical protein KX00_2045 [Francisella sp. TX07-6608]
MTILNGKQKGNIVISAILVLAILAVIAIFAYRTYEKAMEKTRINEATTQIVNLSQGISQLYARSHDFSKITTKVVIAAGIEDKSNVIGETIASPWYSTNNAAIVKVTPGDKPSAFTITMEGIPKDSCALVGSNFISNYSNIMKVNNTKITDEAGLAVACASEDSAKLEISF